MVTPTRGRGGGEPGSEDPGADAAPSRAGRPGAPPRRLVSSYPPTDLTQRVRKIPDPDGGAAAPDVRHIDPNAQPLTLGDLATPLRQRVLAAIKERSRALAHLSVRQAQSAVILVLALGGLGCLLAAWICVHAIPLDLSSGVTDRIFVVYGLAAVAALAASALTYGLARLLHHGAIVAGRGLVGPGLGVTVVIAFWLVTALVFQPWAFPGPANTKTVRLATIESAVDANRYVVIAYGSLSSGTFSSQPAVFLETAKHTWESAPLPQPVPLLLDVALLRARTLPMSAVATSLGAHQVGALNRRLETAGVLAVVLIAVAAGLGALQRSRWRRPPQVPVSDRELRRLVEHLNLHGTVPTEWAFGEDRLL